MKQPVRFALIINNKFHKPGGYGAWIFFSVLLNINTHKPFKVFINLQWEEACPRA